MEEQLAKKYYDKWYQEYIADIDLNELKWIKLNQAELKEFYDENYYDFDVPEDYDEDSLEFENNVNN